MDHEVLGNRLSEDLPIHEHNIHQSIQPKRKARHKEKKQREELLRAYALNEVDNKIARVREIFQITNADKAVRQLIESYTQKALMTLEKITIGDDEREYLRTFALQLMDRKI